MKINPIRIEIKSEQKGMMSCYLQYGLDKKDPREFDSEFVLSNDDEIVIEQERNSASCNIDFYNLIII